MLIDQEKIQEAKERLGDENAFWMAELLELDDFDRISKLVVASMTKIRLA